MKSYKRERPTFPKRVVITAGMPYGNKSLHFGHIGGVFVQADTFARFMRDRIGSENVIFVSGTDCYGSPIVASHKKITDENSGDVPQDALKDLESYVTYYHKLQAKVLKEYQVEPNLYAASALPPSSEMHTDVSKRVFDILEAKGTLIKLAAPQFFDTRANAYLNGRQVVGKCPFEGCQSDRGYADECSLGHQYMPSELIDPISILTSTVPELKDVENWYFDLERYLEPLKAMVSKLKRERARENVRNTIEEFLKDPAIHITRKEYAKLIESGVTFSHSALIDEPKKPSVTYTFINLSARDYARKVLDDASIRYRTGKTLVPFRLSGNIDWGVPVPPRSDMEALTFWVWPESLWAPISFTKTYLNQIDKPQDHWTKFWCEPDAKVYQFIGEDNIYFYGIAEMAMWMAYHDVLPEVLADGHSENQEHFIEAIEKINFPTLVANCHLLFLDSKASSSSDVKPPMADELLMHYTSDQLRMHFLSLGLSKRSVSFNPKPFNPTMNAEDQDVVLKDGNLLTHVFNRLVRSCFYTAQKYNEDRIPLLDVSEEMTTLIEKGVLEYELRMHEQEFHKVIYTLDELIRGTSKYWAKHMKIADDASDDQKRLQVLADAFYAVKVIATLLHPIVPESAEHLRTRLMLNESLWDWTNILASIDRHMDHSSNHTFNPIPPQYDFFVRHPSQL